MNDISKLYWDKAVEYLDMADQSDDVNTTITYTGQAELCLNMARFAADHPDIILGVDPSLAVPGVPQGITGGPKVWGTS